jgi:molybdopterin-guanine dinucleotide biosynthesis protein A
MDGIDKGLVNWGDVALALHAARRLAPQVAALQISANRHLDVYRSWGWPVHNDSACHTQDEPPFQHEAAPLFRGPLAGVLAGLRCCSTPLMMTVPCDVPLFPTDLVARLVAALQTSGARAAVASCLQEGRMRPQPVFALLRADLVEQSLDEWLAAGGARVMPWLIREGAVKVPFDQPTDDPLAFSNVNTALELERLRQAEPLV